MAGKLVLFGVLAAMSVGLVLGEKSCTYYCKNPDTSEYECCDEGNPFLTTTTEVVKVFSKEAEEVEKSESSGCYYYCSFKGKTYCCGTEEQGLPLNHDTHDGRCAVFKEQTCKKDGVYLSKAYKAFLVSKGRKMANLNIETCASDGYCQEYEKCCENYCDEKHTCMASVFDGKETISKTKSAKED